MSKLKNRFLVIGSNSFSGSNFINLLLTKNHKVLGVSRSKEPKSFYLEYKKNKNIKNFSFVKTNLNKNLNILINKVKKFKPNIVVNYAAQGMVAESWLNPNDWYITNIISQVTLYKKLNELGLVKKFIHVTTPEVYGSSNKMIKENFNFQPSTPYAISRATMDLHLYKQFQNFKLPVIFTRTANVFGPGQQAYRIVPKFIISVKKNNKINLHGGGASSRSFIFIDDASKATYLITKNGKIGNTYHISTNNFITIKNLIKKIASILRVKYKKYVIVSKDRAGKDKAYKLSSKKIRKELGWRPLTNLEEGINKTIKWAEKNIKLINQSELKYKHKN